MSTSPELIAFIEKTEQILQLQKEVVLCGAIENTRVLFCYRALRQPRMKRLHPRGLNYAHCQDPDKDAKASIYVEDISLVPPRSRQRHEQTWNWRP